MARIGFQYFLKKAEKKGELSKNGYDVLLLFRTPEGESVKDRHAFIKKIPRRASFHHILKPSEIRNVDARLKIVRSDVPESGCFTIYRRLNLLPTTTTAEVDLGRYKLLDTIWKVSGAIVPDTGFQTRLNRLRVKFQVRSGEAYEEPACLPVNDKGRFSFTGRRMVLNPGEEIETLLSVYDENGNELGRHYSVSPRGQRKGVRIRVGSPFLDVWKGFRATHPQLFARLERFHYDPKEAHENDDTWLGFRRYTKFNTFQVAEGVVNEAKHGPAGDPDWTWDITLDPLYDSAEGFQLPNEKNRLRHGGLHVEACQSLSRKKVPDGLRADATLVPASTRVWMLGTHVFDDAWDFGTPNHEHNELHPLYAMEPCMGGWFHFAVFESIALAPHVRLNGSSISRRWPRTETRPEPYQEAYLDLNPVQCRIELARTYNLILGEFNTTHDKEGLADFFARTSVRYAKLGVDLGHAVMLSLEFYRRRAVEMISDGHRSAGLRNVLVDYLDRVYRFLHGPPSYAHNPIRGPAPQSFLRCVYAVENAWFSEMSANALGESNPRVSLNRATARPVDVVRRELRGLYQRLFKLVTNPTRRGELFAEAVLRYRNWAISTNHPTGSMDATALRNFGSSRDSKVLAQEMAARIDAFWEALNPYRKR